MKNIIIAIFTTCLLCTGCVNENISNISQKDQNLKDLYCLAKEVGCDVKIKLSEEFNQPISKEQFDMYRSLFENISKLDGYTFHLSSDAPKSRVFESFSYSGDVNMKDVGFRQVYFGRKIIKQGK